MSKDEDKFQHSKRIQQKKNYVKRQTEIAKAHGIRVPLGTEHRLQDHAAMNCGIPSCIMCSNPRRIFKEKTIQEKRFYQEKIWKE